MNIGPHDRIKYIGSAPLSSLARNPTQKGIFTVHSIWAVPPGDRANIYFYGKGYIENTKLSDWEVVEKRAWVEKETEYKRAKAYIPFLVKDFKKKLKYFLTSYKTRASWKLEKLPLDKRLKVVMELSPEDKMWFSILTSDADDALASLEKTFKDETK